jgi:hypothetical protein
MVHGNKLFLYISGGQKPTLAALKSWLSMFSNPLGNCPMDLEQSCLGNSILQVRHRLQMVVVGPLVLMLPFAIHWAVAQWI